MSKVRFFPENLVLEADPQSTLLQVALEGGIPHTCVCGGNARCSTCRIVVLDNFYGCLPRSPKEEAVAELLNFPSHVRLACQTKTTSDIIVRRLVLDEKDSQLTSIIKRKNISKTIGNEKVLAILFADIKSFTPFAESLFPFDIIHILNRFFSQMDNIVTRHGGVINNSMGDGFMALFGFENEGNEALKSVEAAIKMLDSMKEFNEYLKHAFNKELSLRIGIHYGPVVMGYLGGIPGNKITAIGDAVNFAQRIENANKITMTSILISQDLYHRVWHKIKVNKEFEIELAGKSGLHKLYEVAGLLNS